MELHNLSPDELVALATALALSLYRSTKAEDLAALSGILVMAGDALSLMAAGCTPSGGGGTAPSGKRPS